MNSSLDGINKTPRIKRYRAENKEFKYWYIAEWRNFGDKLIFLWIVFEFQLLLNLVKFPMICQSNFDFIQIEKNRWFLWSDLKKASFPAIISPAWIFSPRAMLIFSPETFNWWEFRLEDTAENFSVDSSVSILGMYSSPDGIFKRLLPSEVLINWWELQFGEIAGSFSVDSSVWILGMHFSPDVISEISLPTEVLINYGSFGIKVQLGDSMWILQYEY